jgi:hypothetical protein
LVKTCPAGSAPLRLHVTEALEAVVARSENEKKAIREKVRAYRQRMREKGLRPVQIWVPDVRAPGFGAEARRQAHAVASSPHGAADQEWIDSISEWNDA